MLRDYLYTKDWNLVEAAFSQFMTCPKSLQLVYFRKTSPDSFVWYLRDPARYTAYYLYAEDYIPDLQHVRDTLARIASPNAALDLLPVNNLGAFEDSHPNKTAAVYKPPDGEYDFMHYAAQSGFDFVFLAITDERS